MNCFIDIFLICFNLVDFFSVNKQITIITTVMQTPAKIYLCFTKINTKRFLFFINTAINIIRCSFAKQKKFLEIISMRWWTIINIKLYNFWQSYHQIFIKLIEQMLFHSQCKYIYFYHCHLLYWSHQTSNFFNVKVVSGILNQLSKSFETIKLDHQIFVFTIHNFGF